MDSELYFKNNGRSLGSAAEVQSTTLNIGTGGSKLRELSKVPENISAQTESKLERVSDLEAADLNDTNKPHQRPIINRDCQVCIIKEVRQDLINFNKMVQEHNEQISKLKAKFLRSYFERQMMD